MKINPVMEKMKVENDQTGFFPDKVVSDNRNFTSNISEIQFIVVYDPSL